MYSLTLTVYINISKGRMLPQKLSGKESACSAENGETWVPFVGLEYFLEDGMVTHSSFLAWRTPWTEETGGLVYKVANIQRQLKRLITQRQNWHIKGGWIYHKLASGL